MRFVKPLKGATRFSGDNFFDDSPGNVCEPELAPLEQVSQLQVVNAQQVQDGGLQVVDVNAAFGHIKAEVVRTAVDVAALDATAGHPHGKDAAVVVAAVAVGLERTLRIRRTAEL